MWKALVLAACGVMVFGECAAETPPQQATAAASESAIDPARLAAARRVIAANGSASSYDLMIERMVPSVVGAIAAGNGLNEAQRSEAARIVMDEMRAASAEFMELMSRVYAGRMSTEDLTVLAEFYESPAGRRYIQTLPSLLNDSFDVSQAWAESVLVPRVTARALERDRQGRLQSP